MTTTPLPSDAPVLGRYRPVAVLGSGGMGCVYEAVDERLSRHVALKLVHTDDPTTAARSRAEAVVLARLHHPNLVTVYDVGVHDGRPFVVTELVRGRTLRERMAAGPLPADTTALIGAQVASALACAHAHGVVHRDVTPGNVLLAERSGDARLIDFGIAVSRDAPALTATGLVIGTPAYLSPEQVEGASATAASDVYSLGIVLVEALTGDRVFPGTRTESTAARLVADAPVPCGLPPGWGPLLASMTRRDPGERPSASVVADRLGALAPVTAPRAGAEPMAQARAQSGQAAAATSTTGRATAIMPAVAPAAGSGTPAAGARSAALRRRWPIAVAGLALLAGLFVLAVFSDRATDGPVPGVDPTEDVSGTDAIPTPAPSVGSTAVTGATAPATAGTAPTTGSTANARSTAPTNDQGTDPTARGQGKAKGRDG